MYKYNIKYSKNKKIKTFFWKKNNSSGDTKGILFFIGKFFGRKNILLPVY